MKPLQCRMYIGEKSHLLIGREGGSGRNITTTHLTGAAPNFKPFMYVFSTVRCEDKQEKKRYKKLSEFSYIHGVLCII